MPSIQTNGIDMFYSVKGTGAPLLCIMGITATGDVWEAHVEEWSRQYRCIMPDNRGVGLSDKPTGMYTSAMMADDYADLMDALGIETAHVVGCSMGSIIAQQLMLRHPKKVQSAVLMCTWARCDNKVKATFSHMESCKAKLSPSEFTHFIQQLIFSKSFWDNEEYLHTLIETQEASSSDPNPQPVNALIAQSNACQTHDSFHQLSQISTPCLVIGGEEDHFTPLWMSIEVAQQLKHSDTHFYKKRGHAFHFEELEDFNQRVLKWLNKQHNLNI